MSNILKTATISMLALTIVGAFPKKINSTSRLNQIIKIDLPKKILPNSYKPTIDISSYQEKIKIEHHDEWSRILDIDLKNIEDTSKYRLKKWEDLGGDSNPVLLARLIYGEINVNPNINALEIISIGYVPLNRLKYPKNYGGKSLEKIILFKNAFSCFNENNPNLKKVLNPENPKFSYCLQIAKNILNNKYPSDFNEGLTCYYNPKYTNKKRHSWTRKLIKYDSSSKSPKFKHIFGNLPCDKN